MSSGRRGFKVYLKADAALDGLDGEEINADNEAGHRHVLLGYLHP